MLQKLEYICFDLETTGIDTENDRIVQISIKKFNADKGVIGKTFLVNPEMPISKSASEIHGISDEMVIDAPKFSEKAEGIAKFFRGQIITGYNILRFDIPIIARQLSECGFNDTFDNCRFIDTFLLYQQYRPRTLAAAYKDITGKTMENAHDAGADVDATMEVFNHLTDVMVFENLDQLHDMGGGKSLVDFSGKLKKNDSGDIVYAFGKHINQKVSEYPDYAKWMLKSDFPEDTKRFLRSLLKT